MSARTYPLGLTASRLRVIAGAIVGLVAAAGIGTAVASWVTNDSSNNAIAVADTLPQGATPTASLATPNGSTVDLSFDQVSTTGGLAITSYDIARFPGDVAVSASCSGTTTVSCTATGQPDGTWTYRNTPTIAGSSWVGDESDESNAVTVDTTAPTVESIERDSAALSNAASVTWTVTFSEPVTGVDTDDFALAGSATSGATITGVTGSGPYVVTASTGASDGTLGLDVVDDDSIGDPATNPLGGSGAGNGSFTGEAYQMDKTFPLATSVVRASSNPTNAGSVQFTVTFSEGVTGVDSSDFTLVTSGLTGSSITGVTGTGPYTVTVSTGTGAGTLGLDLLDDDSIADPTGNVLGGAGDSNGDFVGEVYAIDRVAPTVSSIVRAATTPTNASAVSWTVSFSEAVTGVGLADFDLANSGLSASLSTITGSGAGPYTVSATVASGAGTLGLDLDDDDSIADSVGNALGGTGAGNGDLAGEVYTVDRVVPYVVSIDRDASTPTNAASVSWAVTFNESVTGVDTADFSLAQGAGLSGASISNVSGSGTSWTVTASTGSSTSGTLGLDLVDDNSITDSVGNLLGTSAGGANGSFTGQVYTVDKIAPTVTVTKVSGGSVTFPLVTNTASMTSVGGACTTSDGSVAVSLTGAASRSGSATCSGGSWTFTLSPAVSAEGEYSVSASQTDAATNVGTSGAQSITIDRTAPTAVSITRNDANPSNAASVGWTVTFSESVTTSSLVSGDFVLTGTATGGASISSLTGSGATRTITVTTGTGAGTLGVSLTGQYSDAAGNNQNDNTTSELYSMDRTSPAVTLTKVNGTTRTFPYTTTADVTTVGGACGTASGDSSTIDVSVTGAASQSGTATCSSGTWSYTLSPELSADGTYAVSATQSDATGNVGTSGAVSITIDTTAPVPTNVALANGGTLGTADKDDSVQITYSEALKLTSVCPGWSGATISGNNDVTVTITENGADDTLTVSIANNKCTGNVINFGSIALGGDYVSTTRTFKGTGSNASELAWNAGTNVLTITLGSASGATSSGVAAGTPVYTPSTSITDPAGNAMSADPFTAPGTSRF